MTVIGRTRYEAKSTAIAKRLMQALIAIEHFYGDPEDILDDAEIYLAGKCEQGAKDALRALKAYYLE